MIRDLFLTSRPLSWVNTAFPFAAAYFVATGRIDATLIVGTVFFLIPYNLEMYGINDVFDYESDLRNPRKGGVEGALLPPEHHRATLWTAILLPLPFVVYLVVVGSWLSDAILAISLFAVLAYSVKGLRFKERPFLDSLTSATHFVSPAVFGLALAAVTPTWPLVALLIAYFLWGCASHAFGAVQDIQADREGGIGSVATVIGARATSRLALVLYLMAGVLLLFTSWPGPLAAVLVVPYALNVAPWWNVTEAAAASANRGWRRFLWLNFVTGFLVTMLLIAWCLISPQAYGGRPDVQSLPADAVADYQLGGAYRPAAAVTVVTRDSTAKPVPGRYSICYLNGFQSQPGVTWPRALLLLDADGTPRVDPGWPDEHLFDISTAGQRGRIAARLGHDIAGCAAHGFQAVEFDNLDSYTRSQRALTRSDAIAFAAALVRNAHQHGLAAGQKNTPQLGTVGRDRIGFDFAVAEECDRYRECDRYTRVYGNRVIDIEYTDDVRGSFVAVCRRGAVADTILRDRDLTARGSADYAYRHC